MAKTLHSPDSESLQTMSAGRFIGTPYYMAPEVITENFVSDNPSRDVWALGVTIYQLVTFKLPFKGFSCNETFRKIRMDAVPSITGTNNSKAMLEVIFATLIKDPSIRPTTHQLKNSSWLNSST